MRVPKIVILASAAITLSACGQINNTTRGTTVNGVSSSSSSSSSNYTPATTTTTTTTTTSSGSSSNSATSATSSQPPTLLDTADNGGSNTLGIGSNITFVAPFQPDSTLTYQWYKNGSKISGATSDQYSLSSIGASDYGYYQVKATNGMGSLLSSPFYVNPILMYATLGSHDCNGSQCWNDATTADKVCKMRFGDQSVIYNPYAYGPSGIKWTTSYCTWNGSAWSCQSNCNIYNCTGYNVLGYVYCLQ